MKSNFYFFTLVVVVTLLVACAGSPTKQDISMVADSVEPETVGMNSATLTEMVSYIKQHYPKIDSVLILRKARKVFENYYNGYDTDTLFLICSAAKTVTSALIGIAIKEGYLSGVEATVADFFPEYADRIKDPVFNTLKIADFLTMTDGLNWYEPLDPVKPEVRENPIKYAFGLPFLKMPGERFNYSTLNSQVLSGLITKTTGMNALAFADKFLFGPLGITRREWQSDLQGNTYGGMQLFLRTRDMAKIGQLYLNRGNWYGKQILPPEWIEVSTQVHSVGPHEKYGYHIYVTEVLGYHAYFAGGFGGQFIYVIPDLELVVAITSETDAERVQHRDIIAQFIIPAITETGLPIKI